MANDPRIITIRRDAFPDGESGERMYYEIFNALDKISSVLSPIILGNLNAALSVDINGDVSITNDVVAGGDINVGGSLGITGPLTMPTLSGSYLWASWNPVDTSGTPTNAPATGTTVAASNYMTIANSSGTVTITFVEAGKYIVNLCGGDGHANVYALSRITFSLGGTASSQIATSAPCITGDSVNDQDITGTISFMVTATQGQTLTVLPVYIVTGISSTSQHAARANMTVCYVGS